MSDVAIEYVEGGLILVPFKRGTKGDGAPIGWNLRENSIQTAEQAAKLNGANLGLCHAYARTCALDVDDLAKSREWFAAHSVDIDALLDAPDAVQVSSGRSNRGKLIFRLPPGVPPLRTINRANDMGLEFRCASKDGLTVMDAIPPSVHPNGQQYMWAGKGDWHNLPVLPDAILNLWLDLIAEDERRTGGQSKRIDIGPVAEGARNTTLTSLAGTMRARGMSAEAIEAALLRENSERCDPPLPEAEVRTIARSVARYEPRRESLPLNDDGNAQRFVQAHGEYMRFVHERGKWLQWDAGWRWDESGEAMGRARETARAILHEAASMESETAAKRVASWAITSGNAGKLDAMLKLAAADAACRVSATTLDADPYLMGVTNGVLDLRTGTLREARREDFVTKYAGTHFDPDAECPTWLAFLGRMFAGDAELIGFIQRMVGYALTGDTGEQCLFIFHGQGANGKSTLLNVLHALLGDYATKAETRTFLHQEHEGVRNDVARLHGARLVSAVEVGRGRKLNEQLVKEVTGGDPVSARYLYQEYFTFVPQFKLLLAANARPVIHGADEGIWRRIRLVPFDVQIPKAERDRNLLTKLLQELPGILAWAVRGCLEWQRGGLREPAAVLAATDEYRADSDLLADFIAAACIVKDVAKVTAADLYEEYRRWCEAEGMDPVAKKTLGIMLAERGYRVKVERCQGRTARVYLGIGLRDPGAPF